MVLLSFFPATLIRYFGVWEEAQNLAGQMFPAWFQTRLIDAEFGKNVANLSNQFAARASRPFKFRTPVNFSSARTHETLPVVAMCVRDKDRSPVGINGCNTTPTQTGPKTRRRILIYSNTTGARNAANSQSSNQLDS